MIVYGDPQFTESLSALLARLAKRIEAARGDGLEELRPVLIQAGQLEQAARDDRPEPALASDDLGSAVERITNHAAAAFYGVWAGGCAEVPNGLFPPREALGCMREEVMRLCGQGDRMLCVKVPEGFEFYMLFPEQYCASALRWAAGHSSVRRKRAVVVGVRSIGTTLSAIVAAALAAAGWRTHRFTVRPSGDVFRRKAEVSTEQLGCAEWALVVDEGPGLSGSSMAAVARALTQAGLKRERIAFLPGHDGLPGPAASAEVRQCWAATPRYCTPVAQLRWNGASLQDTLAVKTAELWSSEEPFEEIEDVGGGLWRNLHWSRQTDWPAVAIPFERPKYSFTNAAGTSILWKFAGLGAATGDAQLFAESAFRVSAARAKENWAPRPLGFFRGFLALPWLQGRPLTACDGAARGVVEHLGRYLVAAAGPLLSLPELHSGIGRLAEMLYCNTKEALGEARANRANQWAEVARSLAGQATSGCFRSFGDGHIAPYEWIRTGQGRILKTDCCGHDADHTIVGRQSVAWDIAGALSEWRLGPTMETRLLTAVRGAGLEINLAFLFFHRLAYAAFRMGQTFLCANLNSLDSAEQSRLWRAHAIYRDELARLLKRQP